MHVSEGRRGKVLTRGRTYMGFLASVSDACHPQPTNMIYRPAGGVASLGFGGAPRLRSRACPSFQRFQGPACSISALRNGFRLQRRRLPYLRGSGPWPQAARIIYVYIYTGTYVQTYLHTYTHVYAQLHASKMPQKEKKERERESERARETQRERER